MKFLYSTTSLGTEENHMHNSEPYKQSHVRNFCTFRSGRLTYFSSRTADEWVSLNIHELRSDSDSRWKGSWSWCRWHWRALQADCGNDDCGGSRLTFSSFILSPFSFMKAPVMRSQVHNSGPSLHPAPIPAQTVLQTLRQSWFVLEIGLHCRENVK